MRDDKSDLLSQIKKCKFLIIYLFTCGTRKYGAIT